MVRASVRRQPMAKKAAIENGQIVRNQTSVCTVHHLTRGFRGSPTSFFLVLYKKSDYLFQGNEEEKEKNLKRPKKGVFKRMDFNFCTGGPHESASGLFCSRAAYYSGTQCWNSRQVCLIMLDRLYFVHSMFQNVQMIHKT